MGAVQNISDAFLNKDFVNAFIQSVVNTHRITASVEISAGKPNLQPKTEKNGEVTGFVGIVSKESKWILSISYANDSILKIYNKMFGENKDKVDNEVADLVGEITNQIYGGAKTMLNQRGYAFEMALPTVVTGNFRTHHHGGGVTLNVPFSLDKEVFNIWIDLTASNEKSQKN